MEAGEDTRKIRSSKPKKKSGKGTQTRSAADEAKRREALKETLREKLEHERKALQIVERLLEDNVTEEFLISCVRHITPANYKDTVEERSIAKLCGYPICSNKLNNVPTQQFKISTKTNKVYDITERKCFCSNFCYKASKCFELQIPNTPLWLRKEESPPEINLMKDGDRGSSGQEVKLKEKPITEADIEDPVQNVAEPPRDSLSCSQSDSSDTEQGFVSSVVSRRHKHARVHWGKLPKRDGQSDHDEPSGKQKQSARPEKHAEDIVVNRSSQGPSPQKDPEGSSTDCLPTPDKVTSVESNVDKTGELLKQCNLEDSHNVTTNPSQPEIENTALSSGGLNITQVGMSKRGVAGLKDLLKDHKKAKSAPKAISLCLLERLRQTFMEWRTEETMKFLYGPYHATEPTAQQAEDSEEELDEDDLDEAEVMKGLGHSGGEPARPSAPAPDFEKLRKETEQMEMRVKEFYEGVCVLPEELEQESFKTSVRTEDSGKDPPLPLVDSHAQHLIQKRIVVEKLSRSLRDVVGPLCLTISDVINDINNLVRTFRFTNTNIIHKSPEWTLIAVVLLSALTEVSPLLRESLTSPSSLEYIASLMRELKLKDEDLHSLVLLFKAQITPQV
ncbi:putative RNA polymerase II subunit B1 CTD phosphatase rpap2 [Paramisgurnus dabryanus]|uniref:putative RNA polymerase II subunit B1 CTD phosphatase rpap2 n=1 Tax=Paramisgurnus dabryanus TaxID=90735 RepID=UPI0031F3F881